MTSRRRVRGSLGLAAALLAIAASPAGGEVAFSGSVSPTTVSSPATIAYGLTMVNEGDAEERFSVALVAPSYGPARAGDAIVESNAIRRLGEPAIEGTARVLGGFTHVAGLLAACSVSGAGGHGYGLDGVSFDVGLPARTTSTVRATYETALPFWPDLDLRLRFVLRTRLTTGRTGTLRRDRKVLTPQPAITGRAAVHMTFHTTPTSALTGFGGRPPIARGTAVEIAGRTNPAIGGEAVELRWARIGSNGTVLARGRAARPRVGASGMFRARWTPPRTGDYELWARYASTRPELVSDDTCPRLLRVRSRSLSARP